MALSDNMRGALLMVGAMTAFTCNDACMKALGTELPLFQALLLRGIATTAALVVLALVMGQLRFDIARRDWGLIALRTVAEAAAAWFFITALFQMPIANVSAILQSLPLAVTLAAALAFGEQVGWKRMTAIAVGFIGVLLIVRPGTDGFTHYSVFALLSVACVTVRDLAARRMTRSVPSILVALVAAAGVTLFAAVGSAFIDWAPVTPRAGWQLAGASAFVIGGYITSVGAMRVGEIGFVAPFRYASLLVALVLGLVLFGDWPDGLTLAGAALVVATGLFTLYRERRAARRVPVGLRIR
ncbi:MAG: EamA family transporter [Limimaricola sp.]|uniref:DMT family transporter n=1 Tax=Limimaricola sp. TaxID=2211665 RepID=UPI001DCC54A0|nr:DMT family transporter [Limimaricola sp.]MBI1417847.1 EamA family transporter [Limimaricola sp.]